MGFPKLSKAWTGRSQNHKQNAPFFLVIYMFFLHTNGSCQLQSNPLRCPVQLKRKLDHLGHRLEEDEVNSHVKEAAIIML